MAGQISLFDIAGEEEKEDYDIKLPDVGEYSKEMMLTFEKEVLGIYVSGHPLEEYEQLWRKNITNTTKDFTLDEELGAMHVADGTTVTLGGMIAEKKIKYTKNDQVMAFLTLEDLVGSVEVIVFPKTYQKYSTYLEEDNKIFLQGRVSAEEDKDGKLIAESIQSFEDIPKELWVQFETMETYTAGEQKLYALLNESEGRDKVKIYIQNPKMLKTLASNHNVSADTQLLKKLEESFGQDNIKVV